MNAKLVAAALALATAVAHAQENSVARGLAATCANCHGTAGGSVTAEVVSLAGLPKEQIVSQMKAFRDGTRPATVMHQIAKGYTDPQIDALAAWFAAQKR